MLPAAAQSPATDWTHTVRIGAYGLQSGNAQEIVSSATADGVSGIEVDNDIEGRYESFLNPEGKLKAIRALAEAAHKAGNHAFVYVAGTECITAHGDKAEHTLAKDHPDWLQRKITGEPAVFGGGSAFWIEPGDEDVWVSPYAAEWRRLYMERIRQIAATGIDGIYVDIPYWMTHFDGWENTWASFDDYTVAAFKRETGLDAKKDLKLGDFSDPNFRKWVDFRITSITDFVAEIDRTAKAVNPAIKTIPEIYPGIEEEAVRVGADVYSLYQVADAITHEYEFGEGDHMASSRTPFDWFAYQAGMQSFRAFAQGKPTWILNYSWDGDKQVDLKQSMMNLAMSEVMAGANFWDAPGHSMAGSNDDATRKQIFAWIRANERTLYSPRTPIHPVGIYFSPQTRNYFAKDFIASYRGILILLMQRHFEFQVVTPRTIADFQGPDLILPDVRIMNDDESAQLKRYVASGGKLIITGNDATHLESAPNVVHFADCPGKAYSAALQHDFLKASEQPPAEFLAALGDSAITVQASHQIATSVASVNGETHVFLANFAGLRGGSNPVQTPQSGVTITVPGGSSGKGRFLPFLGDTVEVVGKVAGPRTVYALPTISKGGVFWIEASPDTSASQAPREPQGDR